MYVDCVIPAVAHPILLNLELNHDLDPLLLNNETVFTTVLISIHGTFSTEIFVDKDIKKAIAEYNG